MKNILVAVMVTLCLICTPAFAVTQQFYDLVSQDLKVIHQSWKDNNWANDTHVHVDVLGQAAFTFAESENAENPNVLLGLKGFQAAFLQANSSLAPDENGLVLIETFAQLALAKQINPPASPEPAATEASAPVAVAPVVEDQVARDAAVFASREAQMASRHAAQARADIESMLKRVKTLEAASATQAGALVELRDQDTEFLRVQGVQLQNFNALNDYVVEQAGQTREHIINPLNALRGEVGDLRDNQEQGDSYAYAGAALALLAALLCWLRYGRFRMVIAKGRSEASSALAQAVTAVGMANKASETADQAVAKADLAQSSAATAVSVAGESLAIAQAAMAAVDSYAELIEWPTDFNSQLDRLEQGKISVYECRLRVKRLDKEFFLLITADGDMFKISGIDDQGKSVCRKNIQRIVGRASLPDKTGKVRLTGAAHPVVGREKAA